MWRQRCSVLEQNICQGGLSSVFKELPSGRRLLTHLHQDFNFLFGSCIICCSVYFVFLFLCNCVFDVEAWHIYIKISISFSDRAFYAVLCILYFCFYVVVYLMCVEAWHIYIKISISFSEHAFYLRCSLCIFYFCIFVFAANAWHVYITTTIYFSDPAFYIAVLILIY